MKLRYLVCAQSASIDARSNNVSLFHVLDEISLARFPSAIPQLVVVAGFQRSADEPEGGKCRLLVGLNDQNLAQVSTDVSFQGKLQHRVVVDMQGLPVSAPGSLTFRIVAEDGQQIAEYSVAISDAKKPVQAPLAYRTPVAIGMETGRKY